MAKQVSSIWEARLGDGKRLMAIPGRVTAITGDYLKVAAGVGKVCLTRLALTAC